MSATLLRLLADASLRATVVALLVAAILGALRVRSSSVRHASWTAVLCAMLLMPLLPSCVPAIAFPVSLPGSLASPDAAFEPLAALDGGGGLVSGTVTGDASSPASATQTRPVVWASPIPSDTPSMRAPLWPLAALMLYGAGILMLSLRCWMGWRAAARIARTGRLVDPALAFARNWVSRATMSCSRQPGGFSLAQPLARWRVLILACGRSRASRERCT